MDIMDWILFEKVDAIAVLTLNQTEQANSFDWPMLEDLEKIQRAIEDDPALKAVVIKANGKHFSAGVKLTTLIETDPEFILRKLDWMQKIWGKWQDMPIPVIAAIQGRCIGAGTELILACDIRIAADSASFNLPEVALGLSPDLGGTTRLTKLVGIGQAKRIIMGNETIGAEEALRIGLVEILVDAKDLEARAMDLARKMAQMPPISMRWAKKGINLAQENTVAAGLLFEQAQSACCFRTEDIKEGINSLIERRKPQFHGK